MGFSAVIRHKESRRSGVENLSKNSTGADAACLVAAARVTVYLRNAAWRPRIPVRTILPITETLGLPLLTQSMKVVSCCR